jgi:hypothetical protein
MQGTNQSQKGSSHLHYGATKQQLLYFFSKENGLYRTKRPLWLETCKIFWKRSSKTECQPHNDQLRNLEQLFPLYQPQIACPESRPLLHKIDFSCQQASHLTFRQVHGDLPTGVTLGGLSPLLLLGIVRAGDRRERRVREHRSFRSSRAKTRLLVGGEDAGVVRREERSGGKAGGSEEGRRSFNRGGANVTQQLRRK